MTDVYTPKASSKVIESLGLGEVVHAEVFRYNPIIDAYDIENIKVEDLIVNNGRIYLAQRISVGDAVASAMRHMAVGTVTTAPALTNSTIPGEVARVNLAIFSTTGGANVWTAVATVGGAADTVTSLNITEAGILNDSRSGEGTMLARVTFAAVTLADSDFLKITHETNVGSNTI